MKIPRDLSGSELIKALERLGYSPTRQTGSHIRLETSQGGRHTITVPNHAPLKVGTLSAILGEVAIHFKLSKDAVAKALGW